MKFLFSKSATVTTIIFSLVWGATFAVSGTITQTITFDITKLQISQFNNYDKLLLSGCEITSQVGQPQLPVRVIHLAIPVQTEVTEIEIISTESQYLEGQYLVHPVQPPRILSLRDQEIQFVEPEPALYSSSGPYPPKLVEYAGRGYLEEHNLASFLVYPVQYFPAQKKLLFYSKIRFTVHYTFNNQVLLPVSRISIRSEKFHQDLVKSLVLNKEEMAQVSPSAERIRSELPEGDYKYVIITSPALESSFLPLAQWKTQKGVPAKIVNTTWIYTNYLTGDHQKKIRSFILDAYQNWGTRWVLLGGDTGVIPERKTFAMDCEAGFYPDENEIPCDLYYAALDGNWNANGNNIFGEIDDEVDLLPEIFVGRAPVSNSTQAQVFVNKILTYEKNSPPDYLLKMLFAAELLWEPPDPYTDQGIAKDAIDAAYVPARFQITKLYQSLGNESRSSVMNAMNQGMNIINHDGHAWYSVMTVGNGSLSIYDMDALRNGPRYSILYSIGCWPAAFDYDCIAEHFINNANGGGLTFIGNSRYGWGSPGNPGYGYSDRFDNRFYHVLFKDDIFNIGATLAQSKAFFAPYSRQENVYRWCMYEINLLGDPEMPIWTDVPQNLTVQHPTVVPVGTSSFSVTVTDASLPIENALVCLLKGEEVYEYGHTDASGQIMFTIAPTSPVEAMAVTVTAHNYLPYEGTCQVISDGPYVTRTKGITIDDSKGNNDGDINPGEEIYLSLELKNYGNQDAHGVTAHLSSTDAMVTITDSTCFYGDIPAAGVSQNYDQFSFMVGSGCQNGHVLYFNLKVTDADTHRWSDVLGLTVATPILAYSYHTATDAGSANPNNLPEPGETINLKVAVKNRGLGVAYNVTANLNSVDPNLSFIQNSGHFGDIFSQQTAVDSFSIEINSNCPTPHFPILKMELTTGDGYQFTDSLMLVIGQTGFSDDMESGEGGWTHGGTGDLWHISQHRHHSGSHSWYCGNEGSWQYDNYMDASLESPAFPIGPGSVLSFWAWYDVAKYSEPGYKGDGIYVEVNNGTRWVDLDFIGTGGALEPLLMGNDWLEYRYDLSNYAPGTSLRVRFRFISDNAKTFEGVYIDDVRVGPPELVSAVESEAKTVEASPEYYALFQNYPNPFSLSGGLTRGKYSETSIKYQIAGSQPQPVTLKIYNILGQEIKTLVHQKQKPGSYVVHWDGKNNAGELVSSGLYLYQLKAGAFLKTNKLIVLR